MMGYITFRAVRGWWRMYQKSRKVPGGPNTPVAWIFTIDVLAVLGVPCTLFAHQWLWFGICTLSAWLLTLMLVAAKRKASAPSAVTRHYAREYARQKERARTDLSPAAMRALAKSMSEED